MKQKLLRLFGSILLASLMVACSQPGTAQLTALSTPTTTVEPTQTPLPPTPTPTPVPDCSSDTPPTFADYASWTRVNNKPIKGHELWVNIYVDDRAKDIYLSASGDVFPACSKIVKTHLEGPESETVTAVTVMVKMPPGYDPEHNDWWWGKYDKDGKVADMSGIVPVCIDCHQPAADVDYVFSKAVMEEAQK